MLPLPIRGKIPYIYVVIITQERPTASIATHFLKVKDGTKAAHPHMEDGLLGKKVSTDFLSI